MSRKYRLSPGLFLFLLGLVCCCARHTPDQQEQTAQVLRVIDGDTIELTDGRIVRYMCIDTPEADEPLCEAATQLNYDLVYGKTITLHTGRRIFDRYGRILARVSVDDIFVAETLVAAGLARVYGFEDNQEFLPPLIIRQRAAIEKGLGIWSALPAEDEQYYVASATGFRFHRPGCASAAEIGADRLLRYASRREAYSAGLSPCRNCRP